MNEVSATVRIKIIFYLKKDSDCALVAVFGLGFATNEI